MHELHWSIGWFIHSVENYTFWEIREQVIWLQSLLDIPEHGAGTVFMKVSLCSIDYHNQIDKVWCVAYRLTSVTQCAPLSVCHITIVNLSSVKICSVCIYVFALCLTLPISMHTICQCFESCLPMHDEETTPDKLLNAYKWDKYFSHCVQPFISVPPINCPLLTRQKLHPHL